MRTPRIALSITVGGLLLTSAASGYYHYIHFATRSGPYTPVPEKFDLTALRNKTVYYFISDQGPSQLAPGDSFAGLVSQIRLAAKTWDSVASSDLRIEFGGFEAPGTAQNAPGIDVTFDDNIPPGLAALGGVTSIASPTTSPSGATFVPITRSVVKIRRDLHDTPSFTEVSGLTFIHEMGHALGLQHTLTSGVMSTGITRGTTKASPLAADDIAAISILYPTGSFLANTATITGRVSMGGAGVNLASVVAISPNGPAISTLTNPDGTYTLQAIPQGAYYIYVHPLPPPVSGESTPANIKPPYDPDGNPIPASAPFDTQFYPSGRDVSQAQVFYLNAGDSRGGVNFSVQPRQAVGISSVTTYGFYGQNAVKPAPLLGSGGGTTIVAAGSGLMNAAGTALAPGLSVGVLASAGAAVVPNTAQPYTSPYIQFGVAPTFGWAPGPRHLVFSTSSDLYILPSGFMLVANPPPVITNVTPTFDDRGNRAALIAGSGFDSTTRILFDGAIAPVIRQNGDGSLLVSTPAANPGYRANVTALNGDGQSSLFIQSQSVPGFSYDSGAQPSATLSTSVLPAGSEAMIDIAGANATFIDGQTTLGFGSSDVYVRRVWVAGNHLLANVSVSANAPVAQTDVTITTGLQSIALPLAFQIFPPNSGQLMAIPPVTNAANGVGGVPAGWPAVLNTSNLPSQGAITVTVAAAGANGVGPDQPATILGVNNGQITFQVPAGMPTGPAIVKLQAGGLAAMPILMNIDPPGPVIAGAFSSPGVAADASHPAHPGSPIWILVNGLPDPSTISDLNAIKVNIGGVDHTPAGISAQSGGALLQVILSQNVPAGGQQPVTITYNGYTSQQFFVPVR
jgi:hypothetical protein